MQAHQADMIAFILQSALLVWADCRSHAGLELPWKHACACALGRLQQLVCALELLGFILSCASMLTQSAAIICSCATCDWLGWARLASILFNVADSLGIG